MSTGSRISALRHGRASGSLAFVAALSLAADIKTIATDRIERAKNIGRDRVGARRATNQ
jgi:hypothetical protein